jgi:SagB-type dehydrogenase family enzyme
MNKEEQALAHEKTILYEVYHENSKQRRHDLEFNRRINLVTNNADFHQMLAKVFKSYPGAVFSPLPVVLPRNSTTLERVLSLRRSIRRFNAAPIGLDVMARLVYFGNGLSGQLDASSHEVVQPVRTAPSAGALYPVEIYAAVMAVDGLEAGLYHYAVDRHGLELLRLGNLQAELTEMTFDPATFLRAAAVLILTAVFGRTYFKYGERGYRFALLEAGHICQNILLEATAQELGAVAVGGFIDDEVNEMLDLDGFDEAAVCLIAVGHPAIRPARTTEKIIDQVLGTLFSGEMVSNSGEQEIG